MKYIFIFLMLVVASANANLIDKVNQKNWIHGAKDCKNNTDLAIDVLQLDQSTFILRQNKCVHFEAPFIYVLLGKHTAFVQDTGAAAESDTFPLYQAVQVLVAQWQKSHQVQDFKILVTHSHSHSDHTAGDSQFRDQPGVTLVEPNAKSVREYFGFTDWPKGMATIDLGGRKLVIIPTPGHQDESITVYDPQTQWLLSGDNIYPGRLYIKQWETYKSSIQRLVEFSKTHSISAIMGTHIEMSTVAGEAYPGGNTYQPDETGLALTVQDLLALHSSLEALGDEPQEKVMSKFIIYPISSKQRILGGFLKWLGF